MNEDFLSDADYRRLCRELSVKKKEGRDEYATALRWLADLGTVVSFPEDFRLSHLTVLNPGSDVRARRRFGVSRDGGTATGMSPLLVRTAIPNASGHLASASRTTFNHTTGRFGAGKGRST